MTGVRRSHLHLLSRRYIFYPVELQEIDESAGPGYLKLAE